MREEGHSSSFHQQKFAVRHYLVIPSQLWNTRVDAEKIKQLVRNIQMDLIWKTCLECLLKRGQSVLILLHMKENGFQLISENNC